MTLDPDPLERELQAYRPRSPSPELRRRVAAQLAAAPRWPRRVALLGGLVAAGLLAAAVRLRAPAPPPHPAPPVAMQLAAVSDPPPTVQAYRRALAESPEALDRLLARHADRYGSPGAPLDLNRLLND
jgi:hypothetical protein